MTETPEPNLETPAGLERSPAPRLVAGLLALALVAAAAWVYGRHGNIEVVVSLGDEARIASELAAYRNGVDRTPVENDDHSTRWLVGHTGVVGMFADPAPSIDRVTANMCAFLTRNGPHSAVDCFEQRNGWRRTTRSSWRSSAVSTSEYVVY